MTNLRSNARVVEASRLPLRSTNGMLCALWVTLWLLADAMCSQLARGADESTPFAVTIVDVDGNEISGTVRGVALRELTIEAGETRRLPTENLLRLEMNQSKPARSADSDFILFANGDRIFARLTGMDEESLIAQWGPSGNRTTLRIPLETVRAFAFDVPSELDRQNELIVDLNRRSPKTDQLLLRNGDESIGELAALDESTLTINAAGGEVKVPRSAVRAALFNSELISFPPVDGERTLLTLVDGSRLTVRLAKLLENDAIQATTLFGIELTIPGATIQEMRFLGGRAVYLSDLEPVEYRFTPFLSTQWPLIEDAAVSGTPLRLGGASYPKGLGMHSQSTVVFPLDAGYRRFLAIAGVDDSAGELGSVVFSVDVDDRRAFSSTVQTRGAKPLTIGPIEVTGAKRLVLNVDFGPFGDVQDHANWCDAVLIK